MYDWPDHLGEAVAKIKDALPALYGMDRRDEFSRDFLDRLHQRFLKYSILPGFEGLALSREAIDAVFHLTGSDFSLRISTTDPLQKLKCFLFDVTCLEYASILFRAALAVLDKRHNRHASLCAIEAHNDPGNEIKKRAKDEAFAIVETLRMYRDSDLPEDIAALIATEPYKIPLAMGSSQCIDVTDSTILASVYKLARLLSKGDGTWSVLFQEYSVLDAIFPPVLDVVVARPSDALAFADPRRDSDESADAHGELSRLSDPDGHSLGSRD